MTNDQRWTEVKAEEWSDAIVAAMKLGGVDNLFFVSGSELVFYQEAIVKAQGRGAPAPRLVTMMNEHVAANAALGNSMVRNEPAAVASHVDVGTLHYGAAIHAAWSGGYPVLLTGGAAPRAYPGSMRGGRDATPQWMQEPRDQADILRQYTKMDHRMEHQDNPGYMVSRLLQVAMSEPKGPVYLVVPRETAMLPAPGVLRFPSRDQLGLPRGTWPDPEDARTIARWLVNAHNPVLFAARSGRDPAAMAELVRLCELLAVPVMGSSHVDRVNFPMNHPLYGVGPAARDADAVVVFEEFTPFMPGRGSPGPEAKVAWISVDPVMSRIKTIYHQADLWLSATPSNVARAIHDEATKLLSKSDLTRIAARREKLTARARERDARMEADAQKDGGKATPTSRWVAYQLGKILEPDAVILNDASGAAAAVSHFAKRHVAGTYFRSGSSAGGWGSGAAFGAKLARPERDVIVPSGDGYYAFGAPGSALWAAAYHKAPYLSVVFNNGSYSTGTVNLAQAYPEGVATKGKNYLGGVFATPDYTKLAESVGGYGETVTDSAQVGPALKRGLDATRQGAPAVIMVTVPGPVQDMADGSIPPPRD